MDMSSLPIHSTAAGTCKHLDQRPERLCWQAAMTASFDAYSVKVIHRMPCRIHRDELANHRRYAVTLFLGIGCILAMTIVHNNVVALIHGHGLQSTAHSSSTLSQLHLATLFRTRKFLRV